MKNQCLIFNPGFHNSLESSPDPKVVGIAFLLDVHSVHLVNWFSLQGIFLARQIWGDVTVRQGRCYVALTTTFQEIFQCLGIFQIVKMLPFSQKKFRFFKRFFESFKNFSSKLAKNFGQTRIVYFVPQMIGVGGGQSREASEIFKLYEKIQWKHVLQIF